MKDGREGDVLRRSEQIHFILVPEQYIEKCQMNQDGFPEWATNSTGSPECEGKNTKLLYP